MDNNCAEAGCRNERHDDWPLCFLHTMFLTRKYHAFLDAYDNGIKPRPKIGFVYYLALSPTSIKIGTTTDLIGRVKALRSEMQYVIAVEHGGHDVERERHLQFAAERLGRRENFTVSPNLQQHIEQLQSDTYSDEILEMYRDIATRKNNYLMRMRKSLAQ